MDFRNYLQIVTGLYLCGLAMVSQAVEQRDLGLAQTDGLYLTVGLEYETGDYGTSSTTDLLQLPVGIDYLNGRLSAGLNTSFLAAKSNGAITVSSMGRMTSISHSTVRDTTVSGIGDVNMYASYRLPTTDEAEISYHITGRVKIGTADQNKGLGTGENDYAIEGGVLTRLQKLYLFANLGYQLTGDSTTVNYKNVWYGNAGTTYPLSTSRSLGAILELSQAATPGFDSPAQLTMFLNQAITRQRQLYFYVLLGLSNGSPDSGAGVRLTIKL